MLHADVGVFDEPAQQGHGLQGGHLQNLRIHAGLHSGSFFIFLDLSGCIGRCHPCLKGILKVLQIRLFLRSQSTIHSIHHGGGLSPILIGHFVAATFLGVLTHITPLAHGFQLGALGLGCCLLKLLHPFCQCQDNLVIPNTLSQILLKVCSNYFSCRKWNFACTH